MPRQRPVFRRRLSWALGLLAAVAVLEGAGAAAALSAAVAHVERGRVASDIRTAFVELSHTKLQWGQATMPSGASAEAQVREELRLEMQQTLARLQALSDTAREIDQRPAAQREHLLRQQALAVLVDSVAELDDGRQVRQLIDASLAREAEAVSRERAAADASLAWMRSFWLTMATSLAALALAAALYFNRALREPLDRLIEGATALRDGRLQHRIALNGPDEFSSVARSFNTMAAELAQHRADEARQRQQLEARVDARTAELREALQALSQADLRRRQLLADVGHELRTPTTAIRGEAEVTLRGADRPAADYRAALRRIVDTSGQLATVIEDLLAMARTDIDTLTLVKRPLDLAEPLRDALLQAAPLAERRGIRLHLATEPAGIGRVIGREIGRVIGDAQRLRQLILILLDNAIHYSADGGEVRLRLWTTPGPDARCCVEVSDDGIGIEAHELPRVFERHNRSEAARRLRPDGHGLGLAIARSLARAHDGEIELVSVAGRGTRARLRLPLAGQGATTGLEGKAERCHEHRHEPRPPTCTS